MQQPTDQQTQDLLRQRYLQQMQCHRMAPQSARLLAFWQVMVMATFTQSILPRIFSAMALHIDNGAGMSLCPRA